MSETTEYTTTIDPQDRDAIVAKIEKANRRAVRLGVAPLEYAFGDEIVTTHRDEATGLETTSRSVPLTITGCVSLSGWSLVATVELDGDAPYVVRSVPGRDGRPEWAYTTDDCDHCHRSNVGRSKIVFLEHEDGTIARVGATCVRDFLGHSIAALTWIWETIGELDDEIRSYPVRVAPSLSAVVAATVAASRQDGYVSRSAADAYNAKIGYTDGTGAKSPTSSTVSHYLSLVGRSPEKAAKIIAEITDADREHARKAIEWAQAIDENSDVEYLRNLRVVAHRVDCSDRNVGLACSIAAAYERSETQRIERETRQAERTPVPVSEKRQTITGTVLGFKTVESDYGTTEKMRVLDDRGFVVYGTVPTALIGEFTYAGMRITGGAEVGDRVRFDARIEVSHDDPTFGFYSRPTKATILETVAA
jgi:hypothetical protein